MSSEWGTPPWHVDVVPELQPLPSRASVVVVGGGLAGLGAAYALARRGRSPVLLDAGTIGSGASGRSGGIVLEHTAAGPLDGVNDCLPYLARLVRDEEIACDLDMRGCWEVVHRRRGDIGRTERNPGLRWHDGDADLVVDDVVPGGTVDVGGLLGGLVHAARRGGATMHEHAEVRRVIPGTPARLEVHIDGGMRVVEAQHVVVALNAYTRTIVPVADDLVPALTLAVATAPLDEVTIAAIGLGPRLPFYTSDLPYLWGRPLGARLIFGSGLAFDREHRVERVSVTRGEAAATLASLEGRVRALHPELAAVVIERHWGGPIAFRSGGAPPLLALHPESPNVIVTGGYAGHGVALSVRIGELAAAAISGERPLPTWGAFAR